MGQDAIYGQVRIGLANNNNNALSNSYSEDVPLYPDVGLMGLSQV